MTKILHERGYRQSIHLIIVPVRMPFSVYLYRTLFSLSLSPPAKKLFGAMVVYHEA